jgi:hypothetical protein
MKYWKEKDVVVVGAGPAGMCAAVAAGRCGADTLLLEETGCSGGVGTSGLLSIWGSFDNADPRLDRARFLAGFDKRKYSRSMKVGTRIIKGIPEEMLLRLHRMKAAPNRELGFQPFNSEDLKYLADVMLAEAGVEILYFTRFSGIEIKKGKAIIETLSKSGQGAVRARIVVDATGDGDVAASAGAPFKMGREKDGAVQGVSLIFRLGGVKNGGRQEQLDPARLRRLKRKIAELQEKGELPKTVTGPGCINPVPGMPGVVSVNVQHCHGIDGTRTEDLTRAIIQGRKDVRQIVGFYRKHMKDFRDCYLIDTALYVGVRETRRIMGEYVLTKDDVLGSRRFHDEVALNNYNIDIHIPGSEYGAVPDRELFPEAGKSYGIPYRCLLPKKAERVILSGRCISSTHEAQASIRIMPCCMATGQAAGTAAALSVKGKCLPRVLDAERLREELQEQGAYLEH